MVATGTLATTAAKSLKEGMLGPIGAIVTEMMRIFPDGIVITSGIYAVLTLSYPFAVLFGSMVEATVLFHLIRYATSYLNMAPMSGSASAYTHVCRTGFTEPSTTLLSLSMFGTQRIQNPFPSSPIYMLSVASAYLFSTLNSQSAELQSLGPAYSSRYYMSMIFLLALLFVFISFRITYGCDTFGIVMLTAPIGIFIGAMLVQQNIRLFGPSAVNLIGIPLLENRTASGKKIYVCPK